jgi:myo-inositol-1(or 4)-monophosphatase
MSKQLDTIKEVVIKAGELALSHQKNIAKLKVHVKKEGDISTKADTECEKLIKDELNKHFEGFSFLAEESGEEKTTSDYTWIIDPIDGTKNFLSGLKSYGCCVCLKEKGETIASVIYFPALDELYYASRDKDGAFLEFPHDETAEVIKLDCSKKIELSHSLVSYGLWKYNFDKTASLLKKLQAKTAGTRSFGASSFEIIKVARGEIGAFIATSTTDWDVYPAGYIAEKAGAGIYDIQGQVISKQDNYNADKGGCIACNKHLTEEILEAIKPTMEKAGEITRDVYNEKICPLANKAVETSTPYVKEACKRSKPHMKRAVELSKELCIKSKPYFIKAWELIKTGCKKSLPYILKALVWLKDMIVKLFTLIKDKIKK